MKLSPLIIFIYLGFVFGSIGLYVPKSNLTTLSTKVDNSSFKKVLAEYVHDNSNIDYYGVLKDENFQSYLSEIQNVNPFASNWSRNDKIAYWVNSYNASVIWLVARNISSINSIKDIPNCWGQKVLTVNGFSYSLNDIEHEILRSFKEPRIHFALVCGANSCPKIYSYPLEENDLNQELDKRAIAFINDVQRNELSTNKVTLSRIFKWFKSDFTVEKTLIEYLNQFSKIKLNNDVKVSYLNYDWTLNNKEC